MDRTLAIDLIQMPCPDSLYQVPVGVAARVAPSTNIKFNRGAGVALKDIKSKPLRGKLQHEQKIQNKAVKEAKLVYEWLKPTEDGYLEAEGIEKTRQFKQSDIVQVI